jgi:hypothetical protein
MRNVYGERWTLARIPGAAAIIGVIAFIAVRAIVDDESWTSKSKIRRRQPLLCTA